ncbi:VOC family protein [Mechercharimyces sp. CAU 1602]|uniref:VOC family protein n=1 Tax=Mechercharimyces sp. CAU 1602 TaxID=2973933 RepID=UPI002162C47F|nr:VOC family protein [Mechercharimyces sp. CAU 1602]MCS1351925.1 VOC family protein [Mechercharimyces sp. CAU 1602]
MNINRLHHVQITIPQGNESLGKHFYCEILGLPEVIKPASLQGRGGFWLQLGPQQIHIGTEAHVNRLATKAHIAYEVDDLKTWHTHLKQHQVEIIESVPIPGFARFEFRDPFGNRIEMIQSI